MLYWGLAYTFGLIALTVFISNYIKYRDKAILNAIIFNVNILLLIVCLTLTLFVPEQNTKHLSLIGFIEGLLSTFIIYTSPLNSHTMYKNRIIPDKFFLVTSAICFFVTLFFRVVLPIKEVYYIVIIIMILCVTYSFFIGFKGKFILKVLPKSNVKTKSHIGIWIVCLSLFALMIFFDLFSFIKIPDYNLVQKFHFLPLAYIFLCIGHLKKIDTMLAIEPSSYNQLIKRFNITEREMDVAKLVMEGIKYKDIADDLYISLSTVKKHISSVYKKTKTTNKIELISLIKKV